MAAQETSIYSISRFPGPYILVVESCSGLRNADGRFGKSDPYVELTQWPLKLPIGRTSTVQNNLNPRWNEAFLVYGTHIDFTVWDDDEKSFMGGDNDFLGFLKWDVGSDPPEPTGKWKTFTQQLGNISGRGYKDPGNATITFHLRQYADVSVMISEAPKFFPDSKYQCDGLGSLPPRWPLLSVKQKYNCFVKDRMPTVGTRGNYPDSERLPIGKIPPFSIGVMDRGNPLGEVIPDWQQIWPDAQPEGSYELPLQTKKGKNKLTVVVTFGSGVEAAEEKTEDDEYPDPAPTPVPKDEDDEYPGPAPTPVPKDEDDEYPGPAPTPAQKDEDDDGYPGGPPTDLPWNARMALKATKQAAEDDDYPGSAPLDAGALAALGKDLLKKSLRQLP